MRIRLKNPMHFNELVIKKGFSKNQFSKEADLSQPTIVQISNGTRNPSPTTAKKITEALGVEFDELFEIEFEDNDHLVAMAK